MQPKSKFELEMEAWDKAFGDKKELKMVLYGTGRMTATLVSKQKGYNIIGLCDRDSSKEVEMYGIKLVNREYVENNADILIINTSESYWNTIFQRIKDWNIPIYFRNGKMAQEENPEEDSYWSSSLSELKLEIEACEYLSFDIFDTLLVRKVCSTSDVFTMVEHKLSEDIGKHINFAELRKNAAANLENPTFDEIYEEIERISGWGGSEVVKRAKTYEWETERLLLTERKYVADLYREYKEKKKIFFISDMYYSADQLQILLKENHIEIEKERILVSSELKRMKSDGELWRYYKSQIVKGCKSLHIGDDEKSDIRMAEKNGIRAFFIRNIRDLAAHSSLKYVLPKVITPYSSLAVGTILVMLFDDPFILNQTKGHIVFENLQVAGACIWGNLVNCFFDWLVKITREENINNIVFFAREGYILEPLFRFYLNNRGIKDIYSYYLEISRRVVMVAAIHSMEDIIKIAEFPYDGTMGDFFADRFNVRISEEDKATSFDVARKNGFLKELLRQYETDIMREAKKERQNYLTYIKSMGISEFVTVDSQLYGSTQYYLSRILDKKIIGLYMSAYLAEDNRYALCNKMYGCFSGERITGNGKDSSVFRFAPFTESFFTAPYGMLLYINDEGKPIHAKEKKNQIYFEVRMQMQDGIEHYIEEISRMTEWLSLYPEEKDMGVADLLFECWMNGGFIPDKVMKQAFYYDNALSGDKEVAIWE